MVFGSLSPTRAGRQLATAFIAVIFCLFLISRFARILLWHQKDGRYLAGSGLIEAGSHGYAKLSDSFVRWSGPHDIPRTNILRHVTGWTIFKGVYVQNGTFFIVSDRISGFPPVDEMISDGSKIGNQESRPTDADMMIIDSGEAIDRFGLAANRVSGVSFIDNDPEQFVSHYYHFCAETLFGLWRVYSSLDPTIPEDGASTLAPPDRFIFPHLGYGEWRDWPDMNMWVLRAAFPSMGIETREDWQGRASTNQPYFFDVVTLTERSAAHRAVEMGVMEKMVAPTDSLPGSPHWWKPVQNNVIAFAKLGQINITQTPSNNRPVITYISRQGQESSGRSLDRGSHEGLVTALRDLEMKHGWEVNVVRMEGLAQTEQIRLAARTTVLIGLHGNGLTALLWMKSDSRATVIEIYVPGGFSPDYQVPAEILGLQHYGVWNDRYFRTSGTDKPREMQPEGFHGAGIPVHGPTVAALAEERIMEPNKLSSMRTYMQEDIIHKLAGR